MEARTDIQHVISFDRPAYPSSSWLWHLRGVRIFMRYPPTHLGFPSVLSLPLPSLFLPPTTSHSPLLLSLFSLARSSPSPAQLYSTGIEMGLSLPGARRHKECQQLTVAHTQKHTHSFGRGQAPTIGGSAAPAGWRCLLVLIVLIAVQYGVLLHQRKSSPTLLVKVGVWWLRSLSDVHVWLRIIVRQISLVISKEDQKRSFLMLVRIKMRRTERKISHTPHKKLSQPRLQRGITCIKLSLLLL